VQNRHTGEHGKEGEWARILQEDRLSRNESGTRQTPCDVAGAGGAPVFLGYLGNNHARKDAKVGLFRKTRKERKMPPVMGAAAFILADMLEMPYVRVMTAAAVPSLLYFFFLGVYVQLQAKKMKIDARGANGAALRREVLADAPIFVLPLLIILILLLLMFEHPSFLQVLISDVSSVAAILALGAAIVGYFYRDLGTLERLLLGMAACFLFGTVVTDNNLISIFALVVYIVLVTGRGPGQKERGLSKPWNMDKNLLLMCRSVGNLSLCVKNTAASSSGGRSFLAWIRSVRVRYSEEKGDGPADPKGRLCHI
jgi:hypothetical protein